MLTKLGISSLLVQDKCRWDLIFYSALLHFCDYKIGDLIYFVYSCFELPIVREMNTNIQTARRLGERFIFKNRPMKEITNAN